jgi:hypothetical protein
MIRAVKIKYALSLLLTIVAVLLVLCPANAQAGTVNYDDYYVDYNSNDYYSDGYGYDDYYLEDYEDYDTVVTIVPKGANLASVPDKSEVFTGSPVAVERSMNKWLKGKKNTIQIVAYCPSSIGKKMVMTIYYNLLPIGRGVEKNKKK